MKDSWLSKNIRPLMLALLTICMLVLMFKTSTMETPLPNLQAWLDLLKSLIMLVYAFYFGGRSMEKYNASKSSN